MPVLAKGKTDTGRCWVYVRDDRPFGGPAPPAAVFYYSRDRGGEHPQRHLAGYAGILQADAYGGYGKLYEPGRSPGPIVEAACWAHARRPFFVLADLAANARRKAQGKPASVISPLALDVVRRRVYTARVTPDIAYSIDDVDRVMRWGFGWDFGPFELFDIIGVREVLAAAEAVGGHAMSRGIPPLIQQVLDAGKNRFREGLVPPAAPDLLILRTAREQQRVVRKNAGASLVDLGDGVFCVEFHSKMNAIGGDTVQMLQAGVKEAAKNGVALVVGNDAPNFSAGANLMLVLLEAQEDNWDELDLMIRAFQQAVLALRYSEVPVVVAPGRADAWRRRRDCAARRPGSGRCRNVHGPGRGRRRADCRPAAAPRRCWSAP